VGHTLGLDLDEAGVCLRALGLWLDPTRPVSAAFVSHAHVTAGALESGRVIASPETLAVAGALQKRPPGKATAWDGVLELPIEPAFGGGTARLSIVPAGHVLGAAQLLVEHPKGRLVYAGDWSGEAGATHPAGVAVACDELVVTTTFALPIFRFEAAATVVAALVDWCQARLSEGVTPLVLAHSPGPAQELVRALSARGLPVSGDEAVCRACAAYEELGVVLGPVGSHGKDARPPAERRAIVAAPSTRAAELRVRGKSAVAYASGWALLDAAVEQKRADAAFVLPDQADFDGVVTMVRATGARRVFATRGDARPFAHLLRGVGLDARALDLPAIDDRATS
jgi:putative mRNA 3-end processing factor